jgi:hypothetical protein
MGRDDDLDVATFNLTTYFGGFADSHVLRGAWLERRDPAAASQAYWNALEQGLPVFRDGLVLLRDAIRRFNIVHDLAPLLEELVKHAPAGALWSASPSLISSFVTKRAA